VKYWAFINGGNMKRVQKADLVEGNWYLLYNNIQDAPYKEMIVSRLGSIDDKGIHFKMSNFRIGSGIWNSGIEFEEENMTAVLYGYKSHPNLTLYELSDDDVKMHVIAEEI
jgi:hypothetical protein